ncbi:unnamed protein product [Tenebrio molitor]|nr:unnamed protein product [Tenebrio molitor]
MCNRGYQSYSGVDDDESVNYSGLFHNFFHDVLNQVVFAEKDESSEHELQRTACKNEKMQVRCQYVRTLEHERTVADEFRQLHDKDKIENFGDEYGEENEEAELQQYFCEGESENFFCEDSDQSNWVI